MFLVQSLTVRTLSCFKQRENEEAAKLYEEFVESFGASEHQADKGPKAFVRGGTIQPGSAPSAAGKALIKVLKQ